MRNLIGLEMICFCRSRHFEIEYEGGAYVDGKGERVEDVLDMNCYVCTASYYTREGDAIPFCPNCGHADRTRFEHFPDLVAFLRGQDVSWLKDAGLSALAVHTFDGDWQLAITKTPEALEAGGRYQAVRKI